MSDDFNRIEPFQKATGLKRLVDDLAAMGTQAGSGLEMESDMLSLIVSGALNGEDISKRYPDFYRRLVQDAGLRAAFLDALESIEAERASKLTPLPTPPHVDLAFLSKPFPTPLLKQLSPNRWQAKWLQVTAALQTIFTPPDLAYRSDPSLFDDHWFRLLRGEVRVRDMLYTLDLESALAEGEQPALSTSLNLAVTLETGGEASAFPVRASLDWGNYHASVQLEEEGRVNFPDIPLAAVFDDDLEHVQADLNLTLETLA